MRLTSSIARLREREVVKSVQPLSVLRDRVARWLNSAAIRYSEGAEVGGIAGQVDPAGRPAFIYGEITGYWLRWASLYAPDRVLMAAAVDFITRQWSNGSPAATRVGANGDWRNNAVFSFDLAMILRGLADAAPVVGEVPCRIAASLLVPWLERMISPDGTLSSHLAVRRGEVPDRWSTRCGPYQAKTAAAILRAPHDWISPALLAAARRTLAEWKGKAIAHRELHARFYAIEGILDGGDPLDPGTVLASIGEDGCFPEQIGHPDSLPRADVQAQGLRLLCLWPGTPELVLDSVSNALCRHIRDDGSVTFRVGDPDANVWCAQFAHQALDWLCYRYGDTRSNEPYADFLI
jgi:hypothetical protein